MFVCVCKAVSDKRIKSAVAEGRALSLRELTRETALGTCCGKCVPHAKAILDSALNRQQRPPIGSTAMAM